MIDELGKSSEEDPIGEPLFSYDDVHWRNFLTERRNMIMRMGIGVLLGMHLPLMYFSYGTSGFPFAILSLSITALALFTGWWMMPRGQEVTLYENGIQIHLQSIQTIFDHPKIFRCFKELHLTDEGKDGYLIFTYYDKNLDNTFRLTLNPSDRNARIFEAYEMFTKEALMTLRDTHEDENDSNTK